MKRGVGMDVIGDIAVVDIPKEMNKKPVINKILNNKNIKTILQKVSKRKGRLRLQQVEYLAGERKTETIHVESGIRLKMDVAKVYFSPRLSGERLRVAKLVRPKESVLVMFSGAGPYVFVIAKMQPKVKEIYGIEINKVGIKNSIESLTLNKKIADKLHFINGDVRKIMNKIKKKFDRIVMPAPHSAGEYLDVALKYIKRNGMIHYYDFSSENDIDSIIDKIKDIGNKYNKKIKILKTVKCGQHSPGIYRICVDFKVS